MLPRFTEGELVPSVSYGLLPELEFSYLCSAEPKLSYKPEPLYLNSAPFELMVWSVFILLSRSVFEKPRFDASSVSFLALEEFLLGSNLRLLKYWLSSLSADNLFWNCYKVAFPTLSFNVGRGTNSSNILSTSELLF